MAKGAGEGRIGTNSTGLSACGALQNLDQFDQALTACNDADSLYLGVGDSIGQARTATQTAHILDKQGRQKESEDKYKEALKLATKVGSMRDRCDALLNYGVSLYEHNDYPGARRKYEESLSVSRQSDNLLCEARATENLGLIAKDEHQYGEAQRNLQKAADSYRRLNVSADEARVLSNLGELYWTRGKLTEARPLLEEAVRRRAELGLKDAEAFSVSTLGDLLLAQDHVDDAVQQYNRAISNRTELKEEGDANETRIHLAAALLEQGKAGDAEIKARELAAWFGGEGKKDPDNEVFARDILIQALLAQSKKKEATEQTRLLESGLRSATDDETKISAQITLARVAAATGQNDEAVSNLQHILAETEKKGLMQLRLEAQLALARVNASKHDPDAEAHLLDLGKASRASGYLLISRKAAALVRSIHSAGPLTHNPS